MGQLCLIQSSPLPADVARGRRYGYTGSMPENPQRADDMAKARKIVAGYPSFVGSTDPLTGVSATRENIAAAVADGIALGRQEGIAMAAEAIAALKGRSRG
jgi:hypothetical protein